MVPAMAMITSCSEPRYRGGFLSVNSAMQQLAMGLAALLAGFILKEGEDKALVGYPIVGAVAVAAGLCSLVLAGRLRPAGGEAAAATAREFLADARVREVESSLDTPGVPASDGAAAAHQEGEPPCP